MRIRRVLALGVALTVIGGAPAAAVDRVGESKDDTIVMTATDGERAVRAQGTGIRTNERLVELRRGLACQPQLPIGHQDQAATQNETVLIGPCATVLNVPLNECGLDTPVKPLW